MDLRLAYRRYSLPFKAPIRTAHGIWSERVGIVLRGDLVGGTTRFAEVTPVPGFGPETIDEDEQLLARMGLRLEPSKIGQLPLHASSLRGALSALVAPVAMNAEAKPLGVSALLPSGKLALDRVPALAELGFRVFKWKVGVGDPRDEQGILDDLCAMLPAGARLRLDANGAWDRPIAERWLSLSSERPIEFIEQPIAPGHRSSDDFLLGLANDFPTPIGLDESLVEDVHIDHWLDLGWQGVFVVKPALSADPRSTLRKLEAAKATVVFSSALETGIGASHSLAHAFSWGGKSMALGFGVWPLFKDSRWDGPVLAPFLRPQDVPTTVGAELWTVLN